MKKESQLLDHCLLHAASKGHTVEALALLSRGANIEARDRNGHTPLILAALNGQAEMFAFLIQVGADIEARTNDFSVIRYAVLGGSKEIIETVEQLLAVA